jgi:hypothetical protein
MRLMRNRLLLSAVAVFGLAVVCIFALRSSASAESTAAAPAVVDYTPPAGPELTLSVAAESVVRFARESGVKAEVKIAIARGDEARARAVMEGEPVTAAEQRESALESPIPSSTFCFPGGAVTCSNSEQAQAKKVLLEEAQSGVYLATLTSAEEFKPPERVPRGRQPVYGRSMTVMVNSHTGIREGLQIGGTASANLGELGTASAFDFAAESSVAQAALDSRWAHRLGTIVATSVVVGGRHGTQSRPAVGERVFLAGGGRHGTLLAITGRRGSFVAHVQAGSGYRLEGRGPMLCRSRVFTVTANRSIHVVLGCDVR